MPKASPMVRSFNAGEFSSLLDGRTDLDRYPSSLRSMVNCIAAPQGPALSRSGTAFVATVADETKRSVLVPFVFSSEQAKVLEFSEDRIRFLDEDGIQVYSAVAATVTSGATENIVFTSATLGASVGDQVFLSGFPALYNLNGVIANVTAKAGSSYTLDVAYPNETVVNGDVARVYHVDCSYTAAQLQTLRYVQSVDVLYLLTGDANPRKLLRRGDYDWTIEDIVFKDGPYMPIDDENSTTLTPDSTGNAFDELNSNADAYVSATIVSYLAGEFIFTAAALGGSVGDWVTFRGFNSFAAAIGVGGDIYSSVNAMPVQITNVDGDDYTVQFPFTEGNVTGNGEVGFARCGATSFRPEIAGTRTKEPPEEFLEREIRYFLREAPPYDAFNSNEDDETYWAASQEQKAMLFYFPSSPFVIDGYTIYTAKDNQDTSYTAGDFAPSTFRLEGFDGTDWVVLDAKEDYILYDGSKSLFFPVRNETAYEAYRLNISKLSRNGHIEPRVRRWTARSKNTPDITFTASSVDGINNDVGFVSTDVGRLLRVKTDDGAWRSLRITAVNGPTSIDTKLLGEPLLDLKPVREWRLGYWSDTTGWPAVASFFEDRMWMAGPAGFPDMFAGSVTGAYETFSQTDSTGAVLDDSAVVGRLNARKLSRVRWLSSDKRGLLLGTGSEEYTISPSNREAITARNAKARPASRTGSADVEPVLVDDQILYVKKSGRAVHEFAYVFEADGYKSPSMSQLAGHLGVVKFVEMDHAADPHSVVWVRRSDDSLVGLTYNRDENVVGWHRHDLSGAKVESVAVAPQKDLQQDALWVVANRTVDGQTRRYIERLTRFWDYDTEVGDAHFVDSGLTYDGSLTDTVYGLSHLEGEEVYGLYDGLPFGPVTVSGGAITLPYEFQTAVVGLGYDSVGVVPRLEAGAADGTAQGKTKRINGIVVRLWNSFGGEVGVWNEEYSEFVYEPLEYEEPYNELQSPSLFTGDIGPVQPVAGYDKDGIIAFRRPKSSPLPFNVAAIMPQLNTQDR